MDKTQQTQFQNMQKSVGRLEKMVNALLRRVNTLERQNRALRAKAHQADMNISRIQYKTKE